MNAIKAAIIDVLKLRALACECLERHIDKSQLKILKVAEESERGFLRSVTEIHAGGRS